MRSPALAAVEKLRRLAAELEGGGDDARWLAACIREYLESAPRGATMDMCLGVAAMPGEVNWWTAEATRVRDDAIRDLAARYYPSLRPGTQAREIERLALRYATASWHHDRDRDTMPERYAGTETAYLWRAFKSGAAMPLKRRQIETVLAAEKKDTAA